MAPATGAVSWRATGGRSLAPKNLFEPLSVLDPGLPDLEFSRVIAPEDVVHIDTEEQYFLWGAAGLACVSSALALAGRTTPTRILDLPSGHGRVLRFLRAAYPDASLTACDLDRAGVTFCAREFDATAVVSDPDPDLVRFAEPFDVIWVGSLLTHLDAPLWDRFLRLFARSLAPEGVLVFTTHGRANAFDVRSRSPFSLRDERRLLRGLERMGFGYSDYRDQDGYGISLSTPAWVCRALESHPDLRMLSYTEGGWRGRQDVVSCMRLD